MFECKVLRKMSKKSNQEYICLEITFPNGYKKVVFLDGAEQFLAQVEFDN